MTNEWLNNLTRELKIRKGIILYGNTRDELFDFKSQKFLLLPKFLQTFLKQNGFEVSALWNPRDGLKFSDKIEENYFQNWFAQHHDDDLEEEGQEYDIGTEASENVQTDLPPLRDINDVVAGLSEVLQVNDRPAVFILDWTDFQFGSVQMPFMENDRKLSENISILLTGSHGMGTTRKAINKAPGVIILITANLNLLPPVLYQNDPRIKLFTCPIPDRPTRIQFFENHFEDLSIKLDSEKTKTRSIDDLADMTEGLKIIDLVQVMKLSKVEPDLTAEKLINLYKFGKRKSPWEDLSQEKLKSVESELKKRVVGQDEAISYVATTIIKASVGLSGIQHSSKLSKPKGSLFFVGPTGVGKTELAKATAEFIFGDESACIRFDMSEYNHEESDQKLIGAPPGYVGYEEGGQLTNAVLEKPFSVLLFDEIEKAHPRILDKFLQILEDGRLTDSKGVTAYFSETVIIFTSNIGASKTKANESREQLLEHYTTSVAKHFNEDLKRPELLNRIGDNIIVFNNIQDSGLRTEIIKRKLRPLNETIKTKYGINLVLDNDLYKYFESRSIKGHGGRGLLNAAERDLINPLSLFIFNKKSLLVPGRTIIASLSQEKRNIEFSLKE